MKILMMLITLIASIAIADEHGFLYCTGSNTVSSAITLNAGDTFTVLANRTSPSHASGGTTIVVMLSDGTTIGFTSARLGTDYDSSTDKASGNELDRTICGPCSIYLSKGNDHIAESYAYCSYRITRAANNALQPSNIISLPADVDGDMQVIVETSTDLLSWEQCYSFTHNNAEGTGRFFRTRIVQSE